MWYQAGRDGKGLSCAQCGDSLRSRPIYDGDENESGELVCTRKPCLKRRVKQLGSRLAELRLQHPDLTFPEVKRLWENERSGRPPTKAEIQAGMLAEARRLCREYDVFSLTTLTYPEAVERLQPEIEALKRGGLIEWCAILRRTDGTGLHVKLTDYCGGATLEVFD